jgi:hypothetical protein
MQNKFVMAPASRVKTAVVAVGVRSRQGDVRAPWLRAVGSRLVRKILPALWATGRGLRMFVEVRPIYR